MKDDFYSTIKQILSINIWFLLLGFIFIFLYWMLRSFAMYKISKKVNKDIKFRSIFKLMLRTQFFNAVTPFATGGQPYQLYYLNKCGIDYATSTSVVLQNFIVYQIALVFLGIVAFISNKIFNIFNDIYILQKLVALGFLINTFVIIIMFVLSFDKKLNKKIINFGIKILTKLNIVKDKNKKIKEWDKNINEFHKGASKLLEDKKNFINTISLNLLALICLYLTPVIVLYSMGDFDSVSICAGIISSAYVMLIGSFVPIPGGSGGLEYGFITFYGNFISGNILTATMLVWRFITYYFGMIIGAIALNIKDVKK